MDLRRRRIERRRALVAGLRRRLLRFERGYHIPLPRVAIPTSSSSRTSRRIADGFADSTYERIVPRIVIVRKVAFSWRYRENQIGKGMQVLQLVERKEFFGDGICIGRMGMGGN